MRLTYLETFYEAILCNYVKNVNQIQLQEIKDREQNPDLNMSVCDHSLHLLMKGISSSILACLNTEAPGEQGCFHLLAQQQPFSFYSCRVSSALLLLLLFIKPDFNAPVRTFRISARCFYSQNIVLILCTTCSLSVTFCLPFDFFLITALHSAPSSILMCLIRSSIYKYIGCCICSCMLVCFTAVPRSRRPARGMGEDVCACGAMLHHVSPPTAQVTLLTAPRLICVN